MRQIVYQREVPAETTEVNGETVVTRDAYLQEERLAFTDADKDIQIAEALKYSYNGEYTIEDDGKPEPVIPPTNEELAAENKRLKVQMEMQAQNITFLENCLLEMGDIVYA